MNFLNKLLLLTCLFSGLSGISQVKNESTLSLDQIMKGDAFVGHLPERISWSDDSQSIYFSWNPEADTISSRYKVAINTKAIKKLSTEELHTQTSNGIYNRDNLWKVFEKKGDIYLLNTKNFKVTQVTNTLAYETNPLFSGDENDIIFQSNSNFFKWNIAEGTTTQITNFNTGKKPKEDKKLSEQDQWLKDQQLQNFQVLGDRENVQKASKYRRELTKVKRPRSIYLEGKRLRGLKISPNLNYVVYSLYSPVKNKNTVVPNFVTTSGYTTDITTRSKVGVKQATSETWIYNILKDTIYQVKTDKIEGVFDKPIFLKDYTPKDSVFNPTYKNPRNVTISSPVFSDDNKAVVNITSEDNKDRWIMSLDVSTGNLSLIDRQHDDAWIGGPEVGWFSQGRIEWLDANRIWFKSEKTGYAHIYIANVNTGKVTPVTSGSYEVLETTLSKDKKSFYLITNKVSPFEQHFYHLSIKTGKMTQITTLKGGHEVTISPDEKQLAIRYSNSRTPWELYVMPNKMNGKITQLTQSVTQDFKDYNWKQPEIIRFKSSDGTDVPATLLKPTAEKNNGAAVIFVHGAGYLQNVHQWWSSYFREYMFHNMLVDNGYTVLAIDFRASSGYGSDWRTSIYRHMGGKDLDDQIDGAKYLIENQGVNKDKIGIYGGSYGGFITLMAMFKYPDTFKSGAAIRSVADWSNYNYGYTAPILNTPVEDSIAYNRSSPIKFAEGLKGNLLILHGMVDTNVHFQDVVQLSQRLIELKKENWEMAVFPVESHGFVEASSWRDEYRRIFKLFQETLNN
ncbi:alpha/beta fold hydrolase [Aureibaculum algae]|uniref:Alpha/beta fold hydrolase n=1 Tax=Aureibaculum algae TaxID=2584122 RepID=A0A5B7TNM0_9FLAO|nr:alpha/beta fold hydrolase [Aureibaculum algae]QCX38479.1 alpha/beta fold hydrolase [Aureibaculum algae]